MKKGMLVSAFMALQTIIAPATAMTNEAQIEDIKNHCDRQYTLVGDTNHDDPSVQFTLYNEKMAQALIDCEVTHAFMEMEQNYQAYIDGIREGNITAKKLTALTYGDDDEPNIERDMFLAKYQFIQTLLANDIAVHAIDSQYQAVQLRDKALNLKEQALEKWGEALSEEDAQAIIAVFEGNNDESLKNKATKALTKLQEENPAVFAEGLVIYQKYKDANQTALDFRLDDRHIQQAIEAIHHPTDKSVIIFGNGHFETENGIQTLLGRENTRWVVIGNEPDISHHQPDLMISPMPAPHSTPQVQVPAKTLP